MRHETHETSLELMSSHGLHKILELVKLSLLTQPLNCSHVLLWVFFFFISPWIWGGENWTVTRAQHKAKLPCTICHIKHPKACLEDVVYTFPNSYCIYSWLVSYTFHFLGPVVS